MAIMGWNWKLTTAGPRRTIARYREYLMRHSDGSRHIMVDLTSDDDLRGTSGPPPTEPPLIVPPPTVPPPTGHPAETPTVEQRVAEHRQATPYPAERHPSEPPPPYSVVTVPDRAQTRPHLHPADAYARRRVSDTEISGDSSSGDSTLGDSSSGNSSSEDDESIRENQPVRERHHGDVAIQVRARDDAVVTITGITAAEAAAIGAAVAEILRLGEWFE
jgi:hypothetical protein